MGQQVDRRRLLQEGLELFLGSKNVYFQPPPNVMLKYPCFIYNRTSPFTMQADDTIYILRGHYSLTYIDPDVERCMDMQEKLLNFFDHISVERSFVSDNLNHDVYNLYY